MTLEQLKQLLESGAITKEQFEAMAKAIDPNYKPEGGDPDPDPDGKGGDPDPDPDKDDLEDIINRAVDRATNKLGNENKRLKTELDKIKKAKLSEAERLQMEQAEKEAELAERESQIKAYENKQYALKAIKRAGLDKGDETAFEIAEFVVADDETEIDERVKAFKKLVDSIVKAEVDATFKKGGRTPDKGGNGGSGTINPFAKATWNLTEQMKLEATDPQLAATLKAQAGVK